jgi:protoporphyrinogen/coproporphyrinogen III oxidase
MIQINSLGLASEVLTVPSSSQIAENRYIMYPRHLVSLPAFNTSIVPVPAPPTLGLRRLARYAWLAATEPLFSNLVSGVIRDVITARRPEGLKDDSIGQFVTRRWGPDIANNFISAITHGLYAGDIDNLSMKALMPRMWRLEEQAEQTRKDLGPLLGLGGVLRAMMFANDSQKARGQPTWMQRQSSTSQGYLKPFGASLGLYEDLQKRLCHASVFSFRDGIESLTRALYESLQRLPNVRIRKNERVVRINSETLEIQTEVSEFDIDHIIGTCLTHGRSEMPPTSPHHNQCDILT